ncbi:MAG: TRAP transporter small permease [Gammaproteobacteria bacterium]|nr:TRAP transporter small permease [Gammaproteobacteria bacterium]MDH5302934.1 TRAP transporter small permease [Gammaproteobacteria bacterium]MDH5321152.1 TRAP transporter small permease [Gammaproteobacteria bacterium]
MTRAATLLGRLDRAGRLIENILLVALLGGMMLLSVGQIVAREIFESGLFWSGEVVRLMVLWLAMIGAVAACREDRHIRVDAISHMLSDRAVGIARMLVDTFAAAVCGVLAWHAWRYLQLEIEFAETVLGDVPAWAAHAVVPVAFALLSYRFAVAVLGQGMRLYLGDEGLES